MNQLHFAAMLNEKKKLLLDFRKTVNKKRRETPKIRIYSHESIWSGHHTGGDKNQKKENRTTKSKHQLSRESNVLQKNCRKKNISKRANITISKQIIVLHEATTLCSYPNQTKEIAFIGLQTNYKEANAEKVSASKFTLTNQSDLVFVRDEKEITERNKLTLPNQSISFHGKVECPWN